MALKFWQNRNAAANQAPGRGRKPMVQESAVSRHIPGEAWSSAGGDSSVREPLSRTPLLAWALARGSPWPWLRSAGAGGSWKRGPWTGVWFQAGLACGSKLQQRLVLSWGVTQVHHMYLKPHLWQTEHLLLGKLTVSFLSCRRELLGADWTRSKTVTGFQIKGSRPVLPHCEPVHGAGFNKTHLQRWAVKVTPCICVRAKEKKNKNKWQKKFHRKTVDIEQMKILSRHFAKKQKLTRR